MKKFLVICVSTLCLLACSEEGYTEYTVYTLSDFEISESYLTDSLYIVDPFYSGSYILFNSARSASGQNMTGGFGVTMKRDSSLVISETNAYPQYTMYATSAGDDSESCAVFYQNDDDTLMPEHDIVFPYTAYGTCTPYSVQINNTQSTVYNVLCDESSLKFESGDYLKLTIQGINAYGYKSGSIEYYLADYRGDASQPDSVLTRWRTISLSKLGQIEYIDFTLETNKEGFPATFCMDNLITTVYQKY